MTVEIVFLVFLICMAMVFFIFEFFPVDVTTILLLTVLLMTGYLDTNEAISGFSNKAVLTIALMFILSNALVKTGVLEVIGERLSRFGEKKQWVAIGVFLVSVSLFSGFINNTAAVTISIPLAMLLCQKFQISPSKILMPLSFAGIYGGTLTLIGTSSNLLVSSILEGQGMNPLGMFEFTKLGIVFLVVGTMYNLLIMPKILRSCSVASNLIKKYDLSPYLTELKISNDSSLIGSTCLRSGINQNYNIKVLAVIRDKLRFESSLQYLELLQGDILIIEGKMDDFVRFKEKEKLLLLTEIKINEAELTAGDNIVVEGLLLPQSNLIGKTLQDINFYRKFGAFVLAIRRERSILRDKIAHIILHFADTLLIFLPKSQLELFSGSQDVAILQEHTIILHKMRVWWFAIAVIPLVMIVAAFGIVSILESALIGVVILLLSRNINIKEAYSSINWSVIVLMATFIPVGIALEKTGTTALIGSSIASLGEFFSGPIAPYITLSILFLITVLFTSVISNASAVILLIPIALAIAQNMDISPRPFIFAVCYGASTCFMTPIGYQTNLMVYGPGGYRFMDFIKAGAPLNLIFWILATVFIPIFWPFN